MTHQQKLSLLDGWKRLTLHNLIKLNDKFEPIGMVKK